MSVGLVTVLALAALFSGACGSGDQAVGRSEVVVFAAASLRDALQDLGQRFEEDTGTKVLFNFAGSNVLAQQIKAASGADLLLSASERWMDEVEAAGQLVEGTRRSVLSNQLVVLAQPRGEWTITQPCDLAELDFGYLALGDPEAVPAGRYARAWLEAQPCGSQSLWQAVAGRVAPSPDVRSALGLVLADPDLVGIVYRTDWLAFAEEAQALYEVPVGEGPSIRYSVAQVVNGSNPAAAHQFLERLHGEAAQQVFQRYGFITNVP